MKRILFIVALMAFASGAFAQTRPGATQVGGLQSDNVSAATILVDANGVVSIQGVVGGQALPISGSVTVAGITTSAVIGGLPTSVVGCSSATCFTTPVMGSAITVSTTTVAPFGTTTTLVQGLHLNNITNAAVTVTITDGNNVPFVGTTTFGASYSIPAVSNLDINMGLVGHVFTSGLNISTATANAVRMWLEGKQ